ncbi:hypothetical protein Bca52824_087988 [Brassica carinata]|uniref:AAA+ ATPase domain-containing protein n=1 Tax=Brassica carinata TaxID=52824 RepID=A0A8X7PBS4_BRACI|nr:hypothetical protein Bca52824_087988 [Brassica carinata]
MEEIKGKERQQQRREIEAINGAWAIIGLLIGLVIEAQTGKGILAQLAGYWSVVMHLFTSSTQNSHSRYAVVVQKFCLYNIHYKQSMKRRFRFSRSSALYRWKTHHVSQQKLELVQLKFRVSSERSTRSIYLLSNLLMMASSRSKGLFMLSNSVLCPNMLSTSSTNIIVGDTLAAKVNKALTFFSSSPNHFEVIVDIETFMKLAPACWQWPCHHSFTSTRWSKEEDTLQGLRRPPLKSEPISAKFTPISFAGITSGLIRFSNSLSGATSTKPKPCFYPASRSPQGICYLPEYTQSMGQAGAEPFNQKGEEGEEIVKSESKSETVSENKNDLERSIPAAKNECPLPKAPEVAPDNEFEKRIRPEVIPANEIGVNFADIGSLDETKESLQELVMLPLRRPDLFKGGLLKPCRGILLFGPPGTGKTMMAKAIANEAGASFINVSMSTITSKWFGEDEKNVRALFTLAAKVSPTIIFVDEVDSMLGQRTRVGEHEAMRKIKNEFMTHWDGLMSNSGDKILVLAATNRPFDLDEAIIRRFERRIMVGLPSNFCTTAAYRPVRELIKQECLKDQERKKRDEAEKSSGEGSRKEEASEERVITLRALSMEDMRAKSQVAASFAAEGAGMNELKQWNDLYGEGGSRKKEQLSYFL